MGEEWLPLWLHCWSDDWIRKFTCRSGTKFVAPHTCGGKRSHPTAAAAAVPLWPGLPSAPNPLAARAAVCWPASAARRLWARSSLADRSSSMSLCTSEHTIITVNKCATGANRFLMSRFSRMWRLCTYECAVGRWWRRPWAGSPFPLSHRSPCRSCCPSLHSAVPHSLPAPTGPTAEVAGPGPVSVRE